jgi:hypothetical protein
MRTVKRVRWLAVATLTTGALGTALLTGCSAGSSNNTSGSTADQRAPAAAVPAQDGAAGAADAAQGNAPKAFNGAQNNGDLNNPAQNGKPDAKAPGAPLQPEQVDAGRDIIYTGTMTVRVDNVDGAAAQAQTLAAGSGGYVATDQRSTSGAKSTATLTLRVPGDKFETVVDQIARLGKPQDRQLSTEDVTAKMVDLNARLKTQQASVDRIRALMNRATTLADVTMLESELSRRQADLESLEAQLRQLSDLTALSTITVTLLGPEAAVAQPPAKKQTGFLAGLRSGWHAFLDSLQWLLTILGAVLPFAVTIGAIAWAARYLVRRRRRVPALAPAGAVAPTIPTAPTIPAPAAPESTRPVAPTAPKE